MAGKNLVVSDLPARRADCAVYGCGALTSVREKTGTGWANFCEHHYLEYHHRKSAERCRELGLTTIEQMKSFCRKRVKGIFKRIDGPVSEPKRQTEEVNF